MEGVDERASDILPQEQSGEGGGEVEIARKESSGGTDAGGNRAVLGEDRGRKEAGGDGSSTISDPERGEMGVPGVHGICEVKYGRSIVGAGGKDRRAE